MKRLVDLTPGDLDRVAVWRYEGETDEVALVRATARSELAGPEAGDFIVRTQFVLGSGAQHVGFCSPEDDAGLESLQPVILTPEGPVYFWFSEPPSPEFLARQWTRLGVRRDEIFPVHFRCTVPVDGRFIAGTITADDLTGAA